MWKRLTALFQRLDFRSSRSRRGREARRTVDARARFWAEVHEGQEEAEKASPARPLAPTVTVEN